MSTRRASIDTPPAFERYMSSREFAEMRALPGNLVAAKAALYPNPRHREMLYWLQSVSLKPGGLKQLARDIIARFPERLGSPTMHTGRPGDSGTYSTREVELIIEELGVRSWLRSLPLANKARLRFSDLACEYDDCEPRPEAQKAVAFLMAFCREQATEFPDFLTELCLDPEIDLETLQADDWSGYAPYFTGTWTALERFKHETEIGDPKAVMTSIGEAVHETLNHALETRRMVVIEGEAGTGKTHASKAWAARHPARARYITLSGITTRTGFFQKIAEAIGLTTCQRKACELQAKIEAFFAMTGIMLICDEAHHAWPKALRVAAPPELIDWFNTALVNQGVPVALVCTDQFARLKERVEKQTGWTSEQFLHRVKRYKKLPSRPTKADLIAVTQSLLPMTWSESAREWVRDSAREPDKDAVQFIVGYALTSRLPLSAVRDAIDEARDVTRKSGRIVIGLKDVVRAVRDNQIPSDAAMKQAFEPTPRGGRRSRATVTERPAAVETSKIRVTSASPAPITANHPRATLAPHHRTDGDGIPVDLITAQ